MTASTERPRHGPQPATVPSLPGRQERLRVPCSDPTAAPLTIALYHCEPATPTSAPPLLLVHGVDATASAIEMATVFTRQAQRRRVVAIDLPGFGASDKPDIAYTPALMRDAIVAALDWIGPGPIDVMALSLGAEFATEATLERPGRVRSLAFISPTGMESRRIGERYEGGRTRESAWLRRLLRGTAIGRWVYERLTSRLSMQWFLGRAWGPGTPEPWLLVHGRQMAEQPGAHHAPLDFVAGALFTHGIVERYRRLPVPLWVCHGLRGSFSDIGSCPDRTGGPTLDASRAVQRASFESGALPHLSRPRAFDEAVQRFFLGLDAGAPVPRKPAMRGTSTLARAMGRA